MIGKFRDRRLKRYYAHGDARLLPADMLARIRSILARLDIAESIDDLRLHSYRLHPLKGDLKGSGVSRSMPTGGLFSASGTGVPLTWN